MIKWVQTSHSESSQSSLSSYTGPGLSLATSKLRALASALEHHPDAPAYLGVPRRVQLARYSKGAKYSRHRDVLALGDLASWLFAHCTASAVVVREVTAILYLNAPELEKEGGNEKKETAEGYAQNGGELLLYPDASEGEVYQHAAFSMAPTDTSQLHTTLLYSHELHSNFSR